MIVLSFTIRQWLFHKWAFSYAVSLIAVSLFILYTAYFGFSWIQPEFYGRVAVAVVNASLMLISLAALLLALLTYHDDRESGLYEWFMSRPLSARAYHTQRWLGLALSLAVVTFASFATALGANYFLFGVFIHQLMSIALLSAFLTFSLTAFGYLIAMALSDKTSALGAGFFLWLYLNFIHTILTMVISIKTDVVVSFALYVLNPVESARFLSFYVVDPTLSFINPTTAIDLKLSLGDLTLYMPIAVLTTPVAILLLYLYFV